MQQGRETIVVSYSLDLKTSPPGMSWILPRYSHLPTQRGLLWSIQRGIYWLESDTLMICMGPINAQPAAEFLTQPIDGQTLFILERVNPLDRAPSPSDSQWMPLGAFRLGKADQPAGNMLVRLTVNQQGVVVGQAYDMLTNTEQPVEGLVDKTAGRIRWTVGADKAIAMETALDSVTANDSTVEVRRGGGAKETWKMTRVLAESPQPTQQPSP
jgi:hypothetical protein